MHTQDTPITYKQRISSQEIGQYLLAVGLPIGIFLLSLIAMQSLAAFGTRLVAPLTAISWCIAVVCALLLPSHRSAIMKETYMTLGIYFVTLMALKEIIGLMSGISSEMLMAAFKQEIPITSGSAISGWLQTLMWITAVMTPIAFSSMQLKKIFTFKREASKEKFFDRIRGLRQNGHD